MKIKLCAIMFAALHAFGGHQTDEYPNTIGQISDQQIEWAIDTNEVPITSPDSLFDCVIRTPGFYFFLDNNSEVSCGEM